MEKRCIFSPVVRGGQQCFRAFIQGIWSRFSAYMVDRMWEMCWILILCSSSCVLTGLKHILGGIEGCRLKIIQEADPLTPCSSRWLPAFLALTGTSWDQDVHCHGDHIQENTGKEGRRRCNSQKYRFGPGEMLFSSSARCFSCFNVVSRTNYGLPLRIL